MSLMVSLTREEVFDRVRSTMQELFEVEADQIQPETKLIEDLELDSIDAIDLAARLEEIPPPAMRLPLPPPPLARSRSLQPRRKGRRSERHGSALVRSRHPALSLSALRAAQLVAARAGGPFLTARRALRSAREVAGVVRALP